jgi:tetratricopeptide (TPR) repeat protein
VVLGSIVYAQGHLTTAREQQERVLKLSREIGDRTNEARSTANLGVVFGCLGRLGAAKEHLERALALSRELRDRRCEGFVVQSLAGLAEDEGDVVGAERLFAQALELRRVSGQREDEARVLEARSALLSKAGRVQEACADLDAALALARELSLSDVELLATARRAVLPGGDVAAVFAALAAHEVQANTRALMHARFLIWQATRDLVHLVEAKRLLDFMVEHAPAECRESMLANVRLHREIAAAAREQGLPLAADAPGGGDERPAGSADF